MKTIATPSARRARSTLEQLGGLLGGQHRGRLVEHEDNTSYGVKGDHGGAQKSVQSIPIVFSGPGVQRGAAPKTAMRSVDITPTILRELGITAGNPLDGTAYPLP